MNTDNPLENIDYDPDTLLDALLDRMKLKNDAALCRVLSVPPPVISKIRHRQIPIGPVLLLRMHEESGLSIKHLRLLMGDRREKFSTIPVHGMAKNRNDIAIGPEKLAA